MNIRALDYTPDGQIKSIKDNNKLIATYAYNHLRQRVSKTTYDDKQNIKEEVQYLWDKGLLSAEIKDDKVIRRYVYLDIMPVAVLDYGYDDKNNLKTTQVYSIHTDHLGTPKAVTDQNQETVWQIDLDTFGETKQIQSKDNFQFNLRFTGQYFDSETGYHYNYHRYYDPSLGRYLTSDPIGLNGGSLNTYAYANSEPWGAVDWLGLKVVMTLNRSNNTLAVIDLDYYNQTLPNVIVSPSQYKFVGIRDKEGKLIKNQILLIQKVFTGGQSFNGVGIYRNPNKLSTQQPMPTGTYHIVTNRGDTNPKHADWFRLDAQDSNPFDDKHQPTGRDGFRLHSGIESHGCTTFDAYNKEAMLGWSVLKQILNSTSTTKVPDRRGKQWMNPWAELDDYGTLKVVGQDNITILDLNK